MSKPAWWLGGGSLRSSSNTSVWPVSAERQACDHPQCWVDDHPLASIRNAARSGSGAFGACAVEAADGEIKVPEKTITGVTFLEPLICLVSRVDADAEKRGMLVVEEIGGA
jgi:hypothetical protein